MRISGGQTCALPILAHTVRVLVVGDLLGVGSSTLEHLSVVDSWQEADADVVAWAEQSHAVLDEAGWPSTVSAAWKSAVSGKSVAGRVSVGGRRIKKNTNYNPWRRGHITDKRK